ncbi:MAG TPA: glycosyltransferase family 4 protein [Burkholderiales bacterium]
MTLLLVTQYFWPEQFIINDLVRHIARRGHNVTVMTGKPNYPGGAVFEGYTESGLQVETFADGVEVFRVPLRARRSGGARNLFLNFVSFVWSGLRYFRRLLKNRHYDAILVFASPITAVIPAIPLKWTKKAHLALWIQDLWPESLSATGFVRNEFLLRAVGYLVRAIYACADTILIQSHAFRQPVARYAGGANIVYYPNSVDASSPMDDGSDSLPEDLVSLLDSSFCVLFAGNLGTAQAVETLVEAAAKLRDLKDCRMVLVGSGSMLDWVRERKSALGLDNLVLAGRFPMSAMPHIYRRARGLIVSLKDEEIFAYTVPSKMQAYLAAGRPIIAALNGEGARVVTEANAGLVCPAEDAAGLAQCIRTLHAMPEAERVRMGESGYAYFLEHFEMSRQAERLIEILSSGARER